MDNETSIKPKNEGASLRAEILPMTFGKIEAMDKQKKLSSTKAWTAKINKALEETPREKGDDKPPDEYKRKNMDRVIGFTAKALTEITEVLQVDNVDFEFFSDETDQNFFIWKPGVDLRVNMAHAGSNKVGIHINAFWNLVEHVRSSPYAEMTSVPQTIANIMAEEVGHIYIERHHPKINEESVKANEIARKTGEHQAYDTDPGENALHEFAQDYADYVAKTQRWPFE